ncbi:MAG: quinone oxidoreductase [Methylobacteriaceae bacterium]|nr:quinone oxidoreductase [Methylobacteriaceae bacterium]
MVKAIVIHKTGGPDVMSYEDMTVPPPGPGQVRIKQHAIGVNYIDIYIRSGLYPTQTPFTLGNEGAGEITQVGEGVKDFKVGDRVAYAGALGGYAEERNMGTNLLVKLPDAISYETAAAMMLKGLTAQYLLRRTYKVKAGDTILFHAAAGGVGLIVCQWAKALGATVIGTVGSKEKGKLAQEAGAHHVIYYRDEDFVKRVNEITKGEKCDVVYDGVGKTTFPGSLDCLKPLGMFVSFGSSSGQIDAFNINLLQQKGSLYATRPTMNTHVAKREWLDEMAKDLFDVVTSGKVKILINSKRKLAEARQVHEALAGRETTGATVLVP